MSNAVKVIAGAATFALGAFTGNPYLMNMGAQMFLSGTAGMLGLGPKKPRLSVALEYSGTVEPRRIIYGTVRASGMNVIPPFTTGTNNKYLHQVLALAGHQCQSITDVYFDETTIASAAIGSISGASTDGVVGSGTFANKAWIRRYLGTSSQTADYILDNALALWTSSHRGRGVAYGAIQYELDEEKYKNGKPEVSFLVAGKLCYDPRLDSSPGANPTNPLYIAYTNNPALILADYLIDADLGMGEATSRIDWAMVETAADICDELVAIPTASTQKRYTCNTVLLATDAYEDNIKQLASAMLGSCLYSGGQWRIRAGAWESPSFEITASSLADGAMEVETAYPYKDRWNGVRGSFIDPGNSYQPMEFPAVQDASYVSDDGESIFKEITFETATNVYEAQRNAMMFVRKSRNRQSAIIACNMALWRARPGDTGIVTIDELGWSSKTVRCEGWAFTPDGRVQVAVREESADDWDDPVEGDYITPLAISAPAPVYFTPSAPSGLASASVPRAINFVWTAPALMPTGAVYELYEYTSSTPFSSATRVWQGVSTNCRIDKSDTTTRYYWVRVRMPDGTVGTEHPTGAGVAGKADPLFEIVTHNDAGPELINGGPGGTGDGPLASFTYTPDASGVAFITVNFTAECVGYGVFVGIAPNVYIDINAVSAFSDNELADGFGVYSFSAQAALTGGVTYTIRLFAKVVTSGADGNEITATNMRFIINYQKN